MVEFLYREKFMIVDFLENCERYYSVNQKFKKAFEFIKKTDFNNIKCGKYEIDGQNIYMNIDEYTTKTNSKPEYHKKYIDIQFLISGEELIGYCPLTDLVETDEFNEKKDIGFGFGVVDYIKIKKGQFVILFPDDAHQPCMAYGNPKNVKKAVIKVKVDG